MYSILLFEYVSKHVFFLLLSENMYSIFGVNNGSLCGWRPPKKTQIKAFRCIKAFKILVASVFGHNPFKSNATMTLNDLVKMGVTCYRQPVSIL